MQKKSNIGTLFNTRLDLQHKITRLQQEKQAAEREMVTELLNGGHHDCFSINWRAVGRLLRNSK